MVNDGYEKSKVLKKEESKEDLRNVRTLHLKLRWEKNAELMLYNCKYDECNKKLNN